MISRLCWENRGYTDRQKNEYVGKTQYGWVVDPVGFRYTLRKTYERYRLPILITENGIGAPDTLEEDGSIHDAYRIDFIREHLHQMKLAITDGVDMLGYCPWAAIDVVSTHQGYRKRYGFIYVDRDEFELKELKRYRKDSFYWYQNVIRRMGKVSDNPKRGRKREMVIKKVLNNNLLLVEEKGQEQIAMGRGLRFSYKVGDQVRKEDVEKVYMLKEEKNSRDYIRLVEDAPAEYAEAIQDAIGLAQERMEGKLNEQIFVTLFDHLIYALERQEKGIMLQNRMLWEIRKFYPKEYQVGSQVLDFLNKRLKKELPEEEAGNIAFHLVNAQMEQSDKDAGAENGMLMVKMLKDIFQIVQLYYRKQLDESSINYSRFVVHMQFFLQRVLEDHMLEDGVLSLYDSVAREQKQAVDCVAQIQKYIFNLLKKKSPGKSRPI